MPPEFFIYRTDRHPPLIITNYFILGRLAEDNRNVSLDNDTDIMMTIHEHICLDPIINLPKVKAVEESARLPLEIILD